MNSAEEAKSRCISLRDQTLASLPSSKVSPSSKLTLHRFLSAELRFLSRLSSTVNTNSLNLGNLESILRAILHPSVHRVSRLCKPVHGCHVDVVCTFARFPAWLLVSDRNPNYIKTTDLQSRVCRILAAAHSAVALKPTLVFLLFSKGVADDVAEELSQEFGAVEVEFLGFGRAFEIEIGGGDVGVLRGLEVVVEGKGVARGGDGYGDGDGNGFGSLVSSMRPDGDETVGVVNFDTTALIAMVSGISNGGCERLLKAPKDEMRARFKSNYEFVIAQRRKKKDESNASGKEGDAGRRKRVMSELEAPILVELGGVISRKKGIICASVWSEFKELVLMCGGPNEKTRANLLIKHLFVVPDGPSERVAALPTTRKIASKNKIVFGTGDHWHAPTLTANMGFVRAISQTGMSLFTIEHRPRALTGD